MNKAIASAINTDGMPGGPDPEIGDLITELQHARAAYWLTRGRLFIRGTFRVGERRRVGSWALTRAYLRVMGAEARLALAVEAAGGVPTPEAWRIP